MSALVISAFDYTIKRINKGLKRQKDFFLLQSHYTIKRINKGLKLFVMALLPLLIIP